MAIEKCNSSAKSDYQLDEATRKALLASEPFPHRVMSQRRLAKVEAQRQRFIAIHGSAFG